MWSHFAGIDFSGGKHAGRKIWIAEATAAGNGVCVTSLERADRKFRCGPVREQALPALVEFIAAQRNSLVGMDFPFSLPAVLLADTSWHELVHGLGARFADQDEFREWCWTGAGNRELRRQTEVTAATPFSSYNRWIKFQTFYGISQVIAPLLKSGGAAFPPMDSSRRGVANVVEICPASTLKSMGLDARKYKGRSSDRKQRRGDILAHLKDSGLLAEISRELEEQAISDHEGDALDAVIAAIAASKASEQLTSGRQPWAGNEDEGWVFA